MSYQSMRSIFQLCSQPPRESSIASRLRLNFGLTLGMQLVALVPQVLMLALAPQVSWGASISAVQGQKALIILDGDNATEGDIYFAVSPEGKKLGVLRIQKVRGGKAIAQIAKGRAEKGWEAVPRGAQVKKAEPEQPRSEPSHMKLLVGAYGGAAIDNQKVTIRGYDLDMTGTGFNGGAFGDYFVNEWLSARLLLGVDTFNASTSANSRLCEGPSSDCATNLVYLNTGGLVRLSWPLGMVGIWGGGGSYLLTPLSKSSNAVDNSTIVITYTFVGALGADIKVTDKLMVPVQFEYLLFPSTSSVSTNAIGMRVGLGYSF